MAYLTTKQIKSMGFKYIGKDVLISTKASIYNADQIEIGDRSRIDDFCVISGVVKIGINVHIAPLSLISGGEAGIVFDDFSGTAYHAQVFAQSDDYSGKTLAGPTFPEEFKNVFKKKVIIDKHAVVGAGSIVMPGVHLTEGTAVGAMSLVRKSTEPWSIYLGNPAKKIKKRSKERLKLIDKYLDSIK